MYEEGKRFNIANFFIKLIIVVIFVLFTVWLISLSNKGLSTSINVLTDEIFSQNIDKMKEVGKSYFTTERLPKKVGDKEKLTLEDMYDERLILELKDKNGKTCSAEESYVSIKKYDSEYQMKVYLKCGSESDYVIVIMGCYDYCESDICEAKTTTSEKPVVQKTLEYQYKKGTDGYWTNYSDWSDWSKTVITNTDSRKVETKTVEESYQYIDYKEFDKECPEGYQPTADKTKCYKSTIVKAVDNPSCPTISGYTYTSRNGFTCNYSSSTLKYANPVCPSGWSRNGFTCSYTSPVIESKDYVYSCSPTCGFHWVYSYSGGGTSTQTATCPTGYTSSGNTCVTGSTSTKTATATCPTGFNPDGSVCSKTLTEYNYKDYNKSCPANYNELSTGDKCARELTGTKKVVYYRYATRQYINGNADYKWSSSNNDAILINAGYKLTGQTRYK